MKIVEQSVELIKVIPAPALIKHIVRCGKACYQTEDIKDADAFIKRLISSGHESVLEHVSLTFNAVTNRGVTHELVRHRVASYSQESTRYCNYSLGKFNKELTIVLPVWFEKETVKNLSTEFLHWAGAIRLAERSYFKLIEGGQTAQQARGVLPIDVKTQVFATMNLRELRHFFNLRAVGTTGTPHPQIKALALDLFDQVYKYMPVVFSDIRQKLKNNLK